VAAAGLATFLMTGIVGGVSAAAGAPYRHGRTPTTFLQGKTVSPSQPSTVPTTGAETGDVNPYGVAVVPTSVGSLQQGNVLVSNFNNSQNQQGTGSTITEVGPNGQQSVFATISLTAQQTCPGGVGLTTALAVFRNGTVVVGSLPTNGPNAGTSAGEQAGCLIVLNSTGSVVRTISGGLINGPWDMTGTQFGNDAVLFVTNVLNGLAPTAPPTTVVNGGTVVRIVLDLRSDRVESETVIANGLPERNDPAALVVGPTGVGLGQNGAVLYVASTVDNRIRAIPVPFFLPGPFFGPGFPVTSGGSLNAPLGLTVAPNGDIITVNGGDGNAVETAPFGGQQVATAQLDNTPVAGLPNGNGTLFGIALTPDGKGLYFVDDGSNTLNLLH
jgi:sugar lactone lactonase YvrE